MTPHITKLKSDLAEKEKYIKQLEVKFVKHHSFLPLSYTSPVEVGLYEPSRGQQVHKNESS